MMKVLLLSPPFVQDYMRNARCDYVSISDTQWPPIWLAYCGSFLEKNGHTVKLVDAPASKLNHDEAFRISSDFSPDLVVVYSSTKSMENDIDFSIRIKEAIGCKLVFAGPFVSLDPRSFLNASENIDYVIRGEFEHPVLEIAEGILEKDIRNLLWRDNGKIIENEVRPLLNTQQLDELPFVTEFYNKHLDMRNYRPPSELHPFVDLFTGRGCYWGQCTFCLWVHSFIPGSVYNRRSIDNVINEFEFVKEEMGDIREIFIQDDSLSKERAVELSNAILSKGLDVVWSCYTRGDLDYDTLALMKKSGCRTVHVGYESSSDIVLKNIKKGVSAERMTRFTEDAKKAGLRVHGDFLLGLPGETRESVRDTIEWAKNLDPDTAQFSLINTYPNTPLHDYLSSKGFLKDNEPSYPGLSNDDLRILARTAVREFYLSFRYARRCLMNPNEHIVSKIRTIWKVVPHMFWKKW